MGIIDKVQGTFEKLTSDDTRLNAAEITTIQQAYNALQLGLVKTELYLKHVRSDEVKRALQDVRDDFLRPQMEKPRRILEKSGIPFLELNANARVEELRGAGASSVFLRDEEILLDTTLSLQATITGLQAGALAAVRGDVRDWFLDARDAAMDLWRKVGMTTYRMVPQALPPTMSGISPK